MNSVGPHSRECPSPRYIELGQVYREMHKGYDADQKCVSEQIFNGFSLSPALRRLRRSLIGAAHERFLKTVPVRGCSTRTSTLRCEPPLD